MTNALINQLGLDPKIVHYFGFIRTVKEKGEKKEETLVVTYSTKKNGFFVGCKTEDVPCSLLRDEEIIAIQNQSDEKGDVHDEKAEAMRKQ